MGLHVGLWASFYFGVFQFSIKLIYDDNQLVINIISLVNFSQFVFLYYILGYFMMPAYLYKNKYLSFTICFILIFYFIYLTNYLTFLELQEISDGYNNPKKTYIENIWQVLLKKGGWLGCFNSVRIILWNYVISFFVVNIFLAVKSVRDIIGIQKRNAKLEIEKISLERNRLALEQENLQLEVNFLKSQINPHFLFNTLNSVYVDIVDTNEQAANQVLKLASLMRYGLYESSHEQAVLTRELDYIQDYLELEEIRAGSQISVVFERAGDFTGQTIAPLLLISFVENAFKHGVRKSRQQAFVHVKARLAANTFTFEVENSVAAPVAGKISDGPGGVGLVNTRKRLNLLYPNRHELRVETTSEAFRVLLSLTFA